MLAFHLVNGLRYARTDFVGILTDLQRDNHNAKAWYQPGNLGYTLNKAVAHNEACSNIFERAPRQEPQHNPRNVNQNKQDQNRTEKQKVDDSKPLPTIIQFKQELSWATHKKSILEKWMRKNEICALHPNTMLSKR